MLIVCGLLSTFALAGDRVMAPSHCGGNLILYDFVSFVFHLKQLEANALFPWYLLSQSKVQGGWCFCQTHPMQSAWFRIFVRTGNFKKAVPWAHTHGSTCVELSEVVFSEWMYEWFRSWQKDACWSMLIILSFSSWSCNTFPFGCLKFPIDALLLLFY